MKKIGILSMQRITNYGSFLQAYALKMMLKELGHDVQFVDYRIGEPLIATDNQIKIGIAGKVHKALEVLQYDAPIKHRIQFILYKKQFAEKYHNILGITPEMNYTPELDVLVIGSDEVFNCVQKNPNVGYSLELFGKNNKAKKLITYAASFGNTTIEKIERFNKKSEICGLLQEFDAISVRDENSGAVVKALTGKSVEYHLDPVLAYDYIGKCNLIPKFTPKEKYLILYAYSGRVSESESEWISAYAKKRGIKVYAIGGVQKCADRFIDCSPFEVLAYFYHADEVITDTFHGTIFSVITKRQFATIVRKSVGTSYGNEEKLTDLLKRLGLQSQIANDVYSIDKIMRENIDYGTVDTILQKERICTLDYLMKQTRNNIN